jgi:hypothetical protein
MVAATARERFKTKKIMAVSLDQRHRDFSTFFNLLGIK